MNITKSIKIGSSTKNDISLPEDEYVSLYHAELVQLSDGRVFVLDYGSTSGTYVRRNVDLIKVSSPVQMHPGDILIVGHTEIPWSTE